MTVRSASSPGLVLASLLALTRAIAGCPADPAAPQDAQVSIVMDSEAPVRLAGADLASLPEHRLTQRKTVSRADAGSAPSAEQSITYSGVLLRDLIDKAPAYARRGREQRFMAFEAVATDGYRAVFSWGELFNGDGGEQVLVVRAHNGQPLDSAQGPLALRALGDFRSGPRHVRNLCAVAIHALGSASR